MRAPQLFTPFPMRGLTLANRVVVSPMCQYSAEDGSATDWHLIHLGQLSLGGMGLLITEACAVSPEGRISPADLGLYSDANEAALARVIAACRKYGSPALGIQLAHAGRKASSNPPWEGGGPVAQGGWETVAPSAVPFGEGWPTPRALDRAGLDKIVRDFVEATQRAQRLGLDLIELHAAHGYLLHEFLSPLSNRRTDEYGGSLENRMRFPLEVFDAIREVWPSDKPLGVRISAVDHTPDGWQLEDSVAFARALKARGCDYVDASSGAIAKGIRIDSGPGYQVRYAQEVRERSGVPTCAVGLITDPHQAEQIIRSGQADLVALARGFLDDPRWVWHAAKALGADVPYPPQYARAKEL
jgi:2,4-dienoyl-CoA reductase-like NADH-dependent reductase (Old Yellow Enzyme family)